ncbi:hypothetical protein MKW94_015156 [Papaver nudicaule]|uniref:Photosystem I reaction center subunit N, chloroplastic n=1 Tax=Papaver nudicaule TaxID=74823 RepID=A0AA41VZ45_PAPNU|nr:hypothetical protein [Papaver nudicaule]MCL7050182.1 hypothetical protein [Papaver nudicaule]
MATSLNSSVLACNYAISSAAVASSEANLKLSSVSPINSSSKVSLKICAKANVSEGPRDHGKKAVLLGLAAVLLSTTISTASANASVFDAYLEKSKVNKELNDKKRLATSGANFARAYTVEFGTCKFPENFTGCQDLAKRKNVPFLSDDLKVECEGKDKFKCGSNVFWKW